MRNTLFLSLSLLALALPAGLHAQDLAPGDPGLQPGDVVEITVWQRTELSGEFTVAQDGTLVHPLYRQMRVTGMPASQVEERLRSFLSQYEANPQVVVRPLYKVSVAGAVFRPDIYTVQPGTTVTQIITLAGGVTETADTDDAQLTRGVNVTEVDLRSTAATQMPVQSGDQILVKAGSTGGFRENVLPYLQMAGTLAHIALYLSRN